MVNSWDELEEDERPPKHIWTDGRKMHQWFRDVRSQRKSEGSDDIEDPVENEAAKGLIVGG